MVLFTILEEMFFSFSPFIILAMALLYVDLLC
jgi:hypothetical protein